MQSDLDACLVKKIRIHFPVPIISRPLTAMQGYRDRSACMQGDGNRFAENPINVTEKFFPPSIQQGCADFRGPY